MSQESTELTALSKIDDVIRETPNRLAALTVSDDIKNKLVELASFTQGKIAGIEGAAPRFKVPEIRLRQPISNSVAIPNDCKPGQLYSSVRGTLGDSVQFIPILRHAQRKKWTDDSKIECLSIDGKRGSRHGDCKECPYSKYEQGKPMVCSSGHTFFVVTPDLSDLFRIDFQKSSAKAGQNILKLTEPPYLWGKVFTLMTEHQTKGGRNYYNLATRATGTRPSAEVIEVCGIMHEFFKAQYERALHRFYNPMGGSDSPAGAVEGDASDVVIDAEDDGSIDFQNPM